MFRKLSLAALLALLSVAASAEVHLARYGVEYVAPFELFNADGTLDVDEADGGAEVSVRCTGGTNATATNDFVDKGSDYEITLTATEMQCATVVVTVAATLTTTFKINTVNNASAAIPTLNSNLLTVEGTDATDVLGTAQTGDAYARLGAPAGASIAADIVVLDNFVDDLESRLGTPGNLGGGATVAGNLSDIEAQTDDIGVAGAGLTGADDAVMTRLGAPAGASMSADIAGVKSDSTAILDDTGTSGVLVSSGTGTGQLSVSSGIINANMAQVSADATAADSLEALLDLQGGSSANGAIPWAGIHASGTAQAYTAGTPSITLASSTTYGDDDLNCTSIAVRGSTQDDWVTGSISDYVGSTDIATLSAALPNTPSGTITYVVWGTACVTGGSGGDATAANQTEILSRLPDATPGAAGGLFIAGSNAATSVTTAFTANIIGNVTGNLSGSVGSLTTNNDKTGYALSSTGLNSTGWPSAWDTEVQSEAADALNAYDPPTNAEMEARTLAAASYATASALTTVDGVVDAIQVTTDKLDDTLEDDAGTYRFTINALEQAPSGGGGGDTDWTSDERAAIAAILGIPGSGTTPADPSTGILDTIRDSVATRASQTSVDDVPTTAEFEARTLAAAGYATASALSTVSTNVGTPSDLGSGASLAANTFDLEALLDDVGIAGAGLTAIPWSAAWDAQVESEVADALAAWTLTEPTGKPSWGGNVGSWLSWIGAQSRNKVTQTETTKTIRNDADDANIATCAVSDDGTTFTVAECTP
jgi:hypothetical protein